MAGIEGLATPFNVIADAMDGKTRAPAQRPGAPVNALGGMVLAPPEVRYAQMQSALAKWKAKGMTPEELAAGEATLRKNYQLGAWMPPKK